MKKSLLTIAAIAAFAGGAYAQGNIAALLIASSSSSNTTGSIILLDTLSPAQTPLSTYTIGATGTGALRFSGSAATTGYLSNTNDRSLVTFTGANTAVTTGNTNTVLSRGVGTFDNSGNFALAATYTGISGNQTRSATSTDNTTYYIADQGGLYTNSSTAPSPAGNFRAAKSFGGTVYLSSPSATVTVIQVGTVPAAAGGTYTGLPGLTNNNNLQDFYLIQSGASGTAYDVLYILSATAATAGIIAKYSLVAGTWMANGTYATTFGGFGLTALNNGGGAYLFVSTGLGSTGANSIIRLTDAAGYNSTLSITTANNVLLYTAPAGATVKGIAQAPFVAPLALQLEDISAANHGAHNLISWTTSHEDNGDYAILTRTTDNKTYTTLATIAGKGANSAYSFTDASPCAGINYYRLKMIDVAGKITYSKTVSATAATLAYNNGLTILPNPATGNEVVLQTGSPATGSYRILLYNATGRLMLEQPALPDAARRIRVALPATLTAGIFTLILTNGVDKYSRPLVIRR